MPPLGISKNNSSAMARLSKTVTPHVAAPTLFRKVNTMEKIKTEKRQPIYQDASGVLYQKMLQTDALRDPNAIREIVGSGKEAEVRWLVPIGTMFDSAAEQQR